jgi:hypothetical protein
MLMSTEVALLESRAMRVEHLGRVDALDKVKALVMLPDGVTFVQRMWRGTSKYPQRSSKR